MAVSKRKSTKKNESKHKDNVKNTFETSFFWMLFGWFVFGFGIVLLLCSLSSVYDSSDGNWLGPYLGKLFPDFFAFVFGKLPFVFFTFTLILWGLFIALKSARLRILNFSIGVSLLTINLSCLLGLRHYAINQPSKVLLSENGGILGQFFNHYVFIPIFGTSSFIAPLIILVITFLLILIISFGLRPRHFIVFSKIARWFLNVFHREKVKEEIETQNIDSEKNQRELLVDDSTIYSVPDGYNIRDRVNIKPFKVKRAMLNTLNARGEESLSFENTLVDNPYALNESTLSKKEVSFENKTICENNILSSESDEIKNRGEDPEILRLEKELQENEHRMSALQIKEIRDKIIEIRRARDLLDWEKAHQNKLVVKGAVRGGNAITEELTIRVNSENEYLKDKEILSDSEQKTLVCGSVQENNLDFTLGDDSFIPEIVTSEDIENDPTYVPPNCISTSEGSKTSLASGHFGVPQPDPTAHYDEYKVPSIDDILDKHEPQSADYTEDELNAIGRMLEEKLENFKVMGKVVGCETGPVITRFEVEPGPGVKVNQFSSLQDDLAMALKATSIRVLTPIPGKGAVGIEIPNRKKQIIYGRDIFESDAFKPNADKIVMALGKDIAGEPFTFDLAKAPHLMIAGQTGSGKSVCINALMASMLFSKSPDELRMILVDPKAVELKMYEKIPHLLSPVITKPEIAIQALQWLCYEMDRRTEILALAKVRNLLGFNEKFESGELPLEVPEKDRSHRMAFIVVVIDEMADLMMVAGKEIEKNVSRLAAKARAVGIHLILATQRPSVKVITGNIKANLPTRISFKVASQVDARTIMDHAGAEKLLGYGDMLFKAVNAPDPVRLHGAFLNDEEAEKLADACSNQNVCYPQIESFDIDIASDESPSNEGNLSKDKKDALLFDVAEWAISVKGLSTSAVQRHFGVGYSRAGKIVDQLYDLGVCGPNTGNSKPRSILIGLDELMNLQRSGNFG